MWCFSDFTWFWFIVSICDSWKSSKRKCDQSFVILSGGNKNTLLWSLTCGDDVESSTLLLTNIIKREIIPEHQISFYRKLEKRGEPDSSYASHVTYIHVCHDERRSYLTGFFRDFSFFHSSSCYSWKCVVEEDMSQLLIRVVYISQYVLNCRSKNSGRDQKLRRYDQEEDHLSVWYGFCRQKTAPAEDIITESNIRGDGLP